MHENFMAHQIMSILDKSVVRAILLHKNDHTWRSADGLDIEVSGLTLCSIIMTRMKPHYKVDIYTKIGYAKAMKLSNYKFNVSAFLDAMKEIKLKTNEKDANTYTNDAFVHDIFFQLKEAPVKSFKTGYELLDTKYMTGKIHVDLAGLMDEAEFHYTNLSNNNGWTIDHNPK